MWESIDLNGYMEYAMASHTVYSPETKANARAQSFAFALCPDCTGSCESIFSLCQEYRLCPFILVKSSELLFFRKLRFQASEREVRPSPTPCGRSIR